MTNVLAIIATVSGLIGAVLGIVNICRKRSSYKVETKDKKHTILSLIALVSGTIAIVLSFVVIYKT